MMSLSGVSPTRASLPHSRDATVPSSASLASRTSNYQAVHYFPQATPIRKEGFLMSSPSSSPLTSLSRVCSPHSLSSAPAASHNTDDANHFLSAILYSLGSKDVSLADKYMKDSGCIAVIDELLKRGDRCEVVTMDLRGNDIRRNGAIAIANFIKNNKTLQHLNLEWNYLGCEFGSPCEILCSSLLDNSSLRCVDLRNNRLESECGRSLASLIRANRALQHIDLRWNNLGAIGGRAIADALTVNNTLQSVQVSGNHIPFELQKSIEEALSKNRAQGQVHVAQSLPAIHATSNNQLHELANELSAINAQHSTLQLEYRAQQIKLDELSNLWRDEQLSHERSKQHAQQQAEQLKQELAATSAQAKDFELHYMNECKERLKTEEHVRRLKEEAERLSRAKEQLQHAKHLEIDALQQQIYDLNKELHNKTRLFEESLNENDMKLQHARRLAESDKELAVTSLTEKNRQLTSEIARLKDEHRAQLDALTNNYKVLQQQKLKLDAEYMEQKEAHLKQSIVYEERLSKLDSQYQSELRLLQEAGLKDLELRMKQLNSARDEVIHSTEQLKRQAADFHAQMLQERQEHQLALDKERQQKHELQHSTSSALSEVSSLKSELGALHSKLAHLQDKYDNVQKANYENLENMKQKHAHELKHSDKKRRNLEEENAELLSRVKRYEQRLRQIDIEHATRQQNLAQALNVLKQSFVQVDETAHTSFTPLSPSHHSHHTHHSHHSHRKMHSANSDQSNPTSPAHRHARDEQSDD